MNNDIEKLKQALPPISEAVLGLKRKTANELAGPCPFCGGEDRFVVFLDSGRYMCRQCLPKGGDVIDYYCEVENTDIKDLAGKYLNVEPGPVKQTETGRYHYHDSEGKQIYYKVRLEPGSNGRPKDFVFYHGNHQSKRGCDSVLYNLPTVLSSDIVYITEGEKHADLLNSWDLCGTTLDTGNLSKIEKTPDAIKQLTGKNIIILPDNDDPGRVYRDMLISGLQDKAASIKVIDLPGLPEKGDIVDWTRAGGTKEELERLVVSTPEWEQDIKKDVLKSLIFGSELRKIECEVTWLLDKLIPEQSITLLSGRGGIGKTWLMMGIADAISRGIDFMSTATRKVPVYYIDFENSLPVLIERIRKINADHVLFWHSSNEVKPPRIDSKEFEVYKTLEPGLLIFDTLRASQGKDENNSQDMALIMNRLKELRDIGFTVLLLHHTPKGNDRTYKGSTAIFDLSDHVLGLYKIKQGGKPDEEIDEDDDNENATFRFGTKDKTRYEPYHIHITFDPDKGFILAPDPDESIMQSIYEIIETNQGMNQSQVFDAVKESLGIKKKEKVTYLLRKGEGKFWQSTKDKNRLLYSTFKNQSLCPPLCIGDNGIVLENKPETCPESLDNQNLQNPINTVLSLCPDILGTDRTQAIGIVPAVELC